MFVLHNHSKTFVTIKPAKAKAFSLSAGQSSEPMDDGELSESIAALVKQKAGLRIEKVENKPDKTRTEIKKIVPDKSGGGEDK